MKMTVITGAIGGLIVLATIQIVMRYVSLTGQVMHYYIHDAEQYLLFMGATVNIILIAGVFRAGGDSRFGFICDTITMWGYAIPFGFFVAFVLKLSVIWVYFLLCTNEFAK